MACDVRERLLHEAERGRRRLAVRVRDHLRRGVELRGDSVPLPEPVDERAERRHEAELVETTGTEIARDAAKLVEDRAGELDGLRDARANTREIRLAACEV